MSRGVEKTRVPLLMRDRSFYHTFLILAGTLILEQAVVLSVNLADNLMIGSYNETALAAVAAVNQIVFVVQQVIYGVTNSVIVLSSQYWGKQQTAPSGGWSASGCGWRRRCRCSFSRWSRCGRRSAWACS